MKTPTKTLAVVIVIASTLGCGDGVQPEQRELTYFSAIETDAIEPKEIKDPGVQLTESQLSSATQIVNGFLENHERLLQEKEVALRIEQIENMFLPAGRFHELVVLYRDDWETRGTESFVADRFAWAMVRLGQRRRAREVIDKLLAARPDEARIHFLDGAAYLQEQPPDPENFPAIVAAWKRVLELDPNYSGYEGIDAQTLRQQIAGLEARIPVDKKQLADDAMAAAEAVEKSKEEPVAEEPAPEEPAAEKPTPEPPVEVAEPELPQDGVPEPPAVEAKPSPNQEYRLAVARGQIALGRGDYTAAEMAFVEAKTLKPGGFEGEFGHLQSGWGNVAMRNKVAAGMRELAKREDLAPTQRIELGVFLWTKLARKDLAKRQFEAAKAADPTLTKKADGLIAQMK